VKPNLSKTDRIVQLLLDILYWIGIAILIASYAQFIYANRQPVVLNIYNSIGDREAQLKTLSPNDSQSNNDLCDANNASCDHQD
jgi:hypothetical protein